MHQFTPLSDEVWPAIISNLIYGIEIVKSNIPSISVLSAIGKETKIQ